VFCFVIVRLRKSILQGAAFPHCHKRRGTAWIITTAAINTSSPCGPTQNRRTIEATALRYGVQRRIIQGAVCARRANGDLRSCGLSTQGLETGTSLLCSVPATHTLESYVPGLRSRGISLIEDAVPRRREGSILPLDLLRCLPRCFSLPNLVCLYFYSIPRFG
jgi:hypothetical protein